MDAKKISEIQGMIKNHQGSGGGSASRTGQGGRRDIPTGAGRSSDDLSKVMTNDVIGKGGESDLIK
jgi:hypothetical protein